MYDFITNFIDHFFNNPGIRVYLVFIIAAFGFGGIFKILYKLLTGMLFK